ncbi:cytochrome c biogenesis protein CcsA [Fimbriimonas ginsengisoli]|uniref:Heme exporter protein C n=1 Tax=Fimbriimonas ginsengisoli Gsoil 348 TaxID=661478 RepID=A0A068NQP0_FIMGI|nr:cytochrome c biogenesis protein CcsA [Fimbriimonas ginsengisoli]AIE85878.1 Cytochrome c-type biogenesis protein CcmC, putative heme lyase for CcmE [Fimbriimonas ginsengisoli Gsoil 348]
MNLFSKLVLTVAMPIGIVFTFTVADAKSFMHPEFARMVFYHLPCALLCSIFLLFLAPYFAFRYLKTKEIAWDVRANISMELALWLGVLTLATGMLFSKYQWGAWWNWDPRQTSFLLTMLMAGAYFAIRAAFADPEKRASNSGAYVLATLLPMLFLIFVFPRLPQVLSLHPDVIRNGGFDPTYKGTFYTMFLILSVFCAALYKTRVRLGFLEEEFHNQDAKLANRDHSAPTGVVRPVSLPTQD